MADNKSEIATVIGAGFLLIVFLSTIAGWSFYDTHQKYELGKMCIESGRQWIDEGCVIK